MRLYRCRSARLFAEGDGSRRVSRSKADDRRQQTIIESAGDEVDGELRDVIAALVAYIHEAADGIEGEEYRTGAGGDRGCRHLGQYAGCRIDGEFGNIVTAAVGHVEICTRGSHQSSHRIGSGRKCRVWNQGQRAAAGGDEEFETVPVPVMLAAALVTYIKCSVGSIANANGADPTENGDPESVAERPDAMV